jgi:hypothetical protein
MRKGQFIKEPKTKFKPKDIVFDPMVKELVIVNSIKDGVIEGQTVSHGQPCQVHALNLLERFTIQDTMTKEEFPLNLTQHSYVYKSGYGDNLKFYTRKNSLTGDVEAVVYAKNVEMMSTINSMSNIGDAYGKYVAGQKAMNEPAKNFKDWFFDISI